MKLKIPYFFKKHFKITQIFLIYKGIYLTNNLSFHSSAF